jgi:hypothetical protein
LSSAATTAKTELAEFCESCQYNFVLSSDEKLYHEHNNANDIAYLKFLVDEAEQFFNGMIEVLEQVCINQIIEAFISGSISSKLAKKLFLDSNGVLPILEDANQKEDFPR